MTPAQRRAARRRAPKHPPGPEAHLRLAVARLLRAQHKQIRVIVQRQARDYLAHQAHGRTDEEGEPRKASALWLASSFLEVRARAAIALAPLVSVFAAVAAKTAASANAQTGKALGLDEHDPTLPAAATFAPDFAARINEVMDLGITRASDVFDEWAELGPDSPRVNDPLSLDDMEEEGLAGVEGKGHSAVFLWFGWLFGKLCQQSQQAAGVTRAMWLTMRDSHVRPAHAELDGVVFAWEDEPPLKAADSDSGEDCFPGEDFGCRCVSSPIEPDNDDPDREDA